MRPVGQLGEWLGGHIARYLLKPVKTYKSFAVAGEERLSRVLQPGDVLLVEGNTRVSSAIKYLTQSTWSHACIYIGRPLADHLGDPSLVLVEVDMVQGVIGIPIRQYAGLNTRICRPVGLTEPDRRAVTDFILERLGYQYDLKNIIDLARYLIPTPPVPARWRRQLIAFGSGDPTRAICSTLLAQAFQSVRYPILPRYDAADLCKSEEECLQSMHYSHVTPRDFDLSPYFKVVKPTLELGFDYTRLKWREPPALPGEARTASHRE
ncbi:MAG: lipo-like protein [Gammaproteobacteria bacterium]|nr:MAG: lipo-like protein [Gammaproteobacteria bacterium]